MVDELLYQERISRLGEDVISRPEKILNKLLVSVRTNRSIVYSLNPGKAIDLPAAFVFDF